MGVPFDYAADRPEHIEAVLNGLDRYNPETTTVFQDYVQSQCENQTYDCYANLALLKLYVLRYLEFPGEAEDTRMNELFNVPYYLNYNVVHMY